MHTEFHISIDAKTLVTHQVIAFKGSEYAVSRITGLTFEDSKQSLNFVTTSRIRSLTIGFSDGKSISIWSQHPILQKAKFESIAKAFQSLSSSTFRQRLQCYTDAWKSVGHFDYHGVRIHADGIIEDLKNTKKRASLRGAKTQMRISFGSSFGVSWIGYSATDPAYVTVYDIPPKSAFSKATAVGFDCNENRDVILAILQSFDSTTPQDTRL